MAWASWPSDNSKTRAARLAGWRAIAVELRDTRRMFRVRAGGAQTLDGMYVRVGGSAVDDGFGPADDEDAERPEVGAVLPWRGSLGGGLAGVRERVGSARALLDRPLTSYYLILGITTLLLCLGLMMVLSTGSVIVLEQHESPYHDFEWQCAGVAVGLPLMWVVAGSSPGGLLGLGFPL